MLAQRRDELKWSCCSGGREEGYRQERVQERKDCGRGATFALRCPVNTATARRSGPLGGAEERSPLLLNEESICHLEWSRRCSLVFQRRLGLLFESESEIGYRGRCRKEEVFNTFRRMRGRFCDSCACVVSYSQKEPLMITRRQDLAGAAAATLASIAAAADEPGDSNRRALIADT